MIKYTEQHEWIRVEGDVGTVGITDYAQHQLGDVVFVELPQLGRWIEKGKEVAVVESVKAASEIYAPVSGVVTEVNKALQEDPSLANKDAAAAGWFFRVKIENMNELNELLDEVTYFRSVA